MNTKPSAKSSTGPPDEAQPSVLAEIAETLNGRADVFKANSCTVSFSTSSPNHRPRHLPERPRPRHLSPAPIPAFLHHQALRNIHAAPDSGYTWEAVAHPLLRMRRWTMRTTSIVNRSNLNRTLLHGVLETKARGTHHAVSSSILQIETQNIHHPISSTHHAYKNTHNPNTPTIPTTTGPPAAILTASPVIAVAVGRAIVTVAFAAAFVAAGSPADAAALC